MLSGPKWERAKEWKIEIVSKDWMWENVEGEEFVALSIAPPTALSTAPPTALSTAPPTALSTTTTNSKKQKKNENAPEKKKQEEGPGTSHPPPGAHPPPTEVPGKTLAALKELADMPDMVSNKNSFKVKRKRGSILRDTNTNITGKPPLLSGVDDVEDSQFIGWG